MFVGPPVNHPPVSRPVPTRIHWGFSTLLVRQSPKTHIHVAHPVLTGKDLPQMGAGERR